MTGRLLPLARHPALRFALLGGLLFALTGGLDRAPTGGVDTAPTGDAPPAGASEPSDRELLLREAYARGYHETDPIVRRRLARNLRFAGASDALDDAALVRDAIALGMHRSDVVVRRRLVQKMELLAAARARADEPDEAELRAFLDAHRERFVEPARTTIEQRFFEDPARASAALARVRRGEDPDGDAIAIPRVLPPLSDAELDRRFGPGFAQAVSQVDAGAWTGPVASAFGAHLVRVVAREPARPSALAAVRGEVREALLAERAARALAEEVARLRGGPGGPGGPGRLGAPGRLDGPEASGAG